VGTRGGAADHAAIKLSRRGYVTRVGFFPFRIEDSAKFLPGYNLVVCNSGVYAGKSKGARNTFNAKVTAYHIGRVWFKMLHPELASKIGHLRDINAKHLGLSRAQFAHSLRQLPRRVTRAQVQAAFSQMAEAERDRIERLFLSHEAPAEGYAVRDVVVFGLSEMERAQKCLDLLRHNDAEALGRMMTVSHDGDRVSRESSRHTWQRVTAEAADRAFENWAKPGNRKADLADLSGAYACSLPELDRIADLAQRLTGVAGAQLAGAGLGGCIMVLVQKVHTPNLLKELNARGIQAEVFRPIAGACSLAIC
jgi:N-acetylgalactosamine kinase